MKTCRTCKKTKPEDEFHSVSKYNIRTSCKKCRLEILHKHYVENTEEMRERNNRYYRNRKASGYFQTEEYKAKRREMYRRRRNHERKKMLEML